MLDKNTPIGLTFDDVLILPSKSEVLPREISVQTRLSKKISLKIPLVSAAMDTVTESKTAICIAKEGGIGIIHRNMSIESQAREIEKVKKSESGIIKDPISVGPKKKVSEVLKVMEEYQISGVPVIDDKGKLIGILTNRDLRFEKNLEQPVAQVMTKENLITAPEGTDLEQAKEILQKHRIEKLPVVDKTGILKGLITVKDIQKRLRFPNASKDFHGRLLVGGAVGVGDEGFQRAQALLSAGADVVVVDTAHAHSLGVAKVVERIKSHLPDCQIIAGNVATGEGTRYLIESGADGVKVGVGPGSICSTRIVAGVGVPQLKAIQDCCSVANKHDVPVISDGGIKFSGDITKALAAGANAVMVGSLFAGTDESPGEVFLYQGRSYKSYRGMGSIGAMNTGSKDRYGQQGITEESKLVPEGIEGMIPYRGPLSSIIYQLVGGLRSGMGYVGAKDIGELQKKAKFIKISSSGLRESHVHDVIITKEAPNYRLG